MRLEDLYQNFGKATPAMQAKYISEYRLRRDQDLSKTPTWPKQKKVPTGKRKPKVVLTPEEKTLMKLLGLKKKDVVALRAIAEEE